MIISCNFIYKRCFHVPLIFISSFLREISLIRIFQARRRKEIWRMRSRWHLLWSQGHNNLQENAHAIRKQNDATRLYLYLTVHYAVSDLRCFYLTHQLINVNFLHVRPCINSHRRCDDLLVPRWHLA